MSPQSSILRQEDGHGRLQLHPPESHQLFLMPPALQDWLPPDDLAYFLLDAVDQFDLAPFHAAYRVDGVGQAAFQPHVMVALLLYAYCLGVRSSRQIERLCQRDVAYLRA